MLRCDINMKQSGTSLDLDEVPMTQALTLTLGSLPLSALLLKGGREHDLVLLFLYCAVAAGILAWLSAPVLAWVPDASTL